MPAVDASRMVKWTRIRSAKHVNIKLKWLWRNLFGLWDFFQLAISNKLISLDWGRGLLVISL